MRIVACLSCKWYIGKITNTSDLRCKAFEAIPEEIRSGKNNHKKPYRGDGGIQFEKAEDDNSNQRPATISEIAN